VTMAACCRHAGGSGWKRGAEPPVRVTMALAAAIEGGSGGGGVAERATEMYIVTD
jgi:hypothetical protein